MTDLTDERLREIAAGKPIPLAVCAATGDPSWAEVRQNAAELLAARAEVRRLRAIEAAAREYVLETTRGTFESAGKAFFVLGRALAAKENAK